MIVTLTPEHEAWLRARVAKGDFASLDDAVREMLDARMVEESDDLAWAKPYVGEARAAVARGETISLEEHKARNRARLARHAG
jgi:antitoxin ParD1/3/4